MRTLETPLKLQEMQLMRFVSSINTVPELLFGIATNTEVDRRWSGVLGQALAGLLTVTTSLAEAELYEVVIGAARRLFIRASGNGAAESSCAATLGGQGLEVARTQDLASAVRRQSSRHVDEVPGPRSTSQTDQATFTECARNKTRVGTLSGVGSGVLAITSQSVSRQSDRNG